MKAYMIVGAGYGDEGKGLITDWQVGQLVAEGRRPVVVRANGGVQAAHTVVTPMGDRHVFKHHGSGSFHGAATFLAHTFLVNPIGFREEREAMPEEARGPVYASPYAHVGLPVDMMLNQMMEERRGGSRHGSCGWGIGEGVERCGTKQWRLTTTDVYSEEFSWEAAHKISQEYLAHRLPELELSIADLTADWQARLTDQKITQRWAEDCRYLAEHCTLWPTRDLDKLGDVLVFEGAQGLGLDERGDHFPHVTRSRTGHHNPMMVAQEAGVTDLEPIYVTRCYATRHGAGPLEHEGEPHGCNVDDPTNQPNPWQGTLRSAPLDMDLFVRRASRDFTDVLRLYPKARLNVAVTCLDQAGKDFAYAAQIPGPDPESDKQPIFMAERLVIAVAQASFTDGFNSHGCRLLLSTGPTRDDVMVHLEETKDVRTRVLEVVARMAPHMLSQMEERLPRDRF